VNIGSAVPTGSSLSSSPSKKLAWNPATMLRGGRSYLRWRNPPAGRDTGLSQLTAARLGCEEVVSKAPPNQSLQGSKQSPLCCMLMNPHPPNLWLYNVCHKVLGPFVIWP
jgi:hypothetical protein